MGASNVPKSAAGSSAGERYTDNKLKHDIRMSNMNAAGAYTFPLYSST
jgi:hypothetical protein